MMSARDMDVVVRDARQARIDAVGDAELSLQADKAWCCLFTAQRHALLYQRALNNAAEARTAAEQYAVQPGRTRLAEMMRIRAAEYEQIAENHRIAGEKCHEDGEILEAEVLTIEHRKLLEHQREQAPAQAAPQHEQRVRRPQREPHHEAPAHHPGDDGDGQ
jgi:hypothetical protein